MHASFEKVVKMNGYDNLKRLDRAVQASVALELGEAANDDGAFAELGVAPRRTRTIAGLRVASVAARDAKVDPEAGKMLKRLRQYRSDRDCVLEKLRRVGVEPIAVLPLTAWEHVCDSASLFRFTPREDAVRVALPESTMEGIARDAKRKGLFFGIAVSLFFFGASFGFGALSQYVLGLFCVPCVLCFLFATFVAAGEMGLLSENVAPPDPEWTRRMETKSIRAFVAKHERAGTLVKELWPNFREPAEGSDVRVAFPDPPAEVAQRLVAAARTGLPMRLAVVGEAIAFKESVADVLIGERRAHWEMEESRYQALKLLDPIVYIVEGTAVAIIDQYGDFPIEKEVIERVINSEHLV